MVLANIKVSPIREFELIEVIANLIGDPKKPMKKENSDFVDHNIFRYGVFAGNAVPFPYSIDDKHYSVDYDDFASLKSGHDICENIIDCYMSVIKDKEIFYHGKGLKRWATFRQMPTWFLCLNTMSLNTTNEHE